jgi:hypothetical protein
MYGDSEPVRERQPPHILFTQAHPHEPRNEPTQLATTPIAKGSTDRGMN